MTYQFEKKQYIGPWENNLKHGIGLELNITANTKRQGEWRRGKWFQWVGPPQQIDEHVREQMLEAL